MIAVEAIAVLEFVIVAPERQRFRHFLIGQGPVSVLVVQIVRAILKKYTDRLHGFGLANERRIIVPPFAQSWAAGDVGEAAYPRKHFAEFVGALPGCSKCANAAAASARNGAACRVVPELGRFLYSR